MSQYKRTIILFYLNIYLNFEVKMKIMSKIMNQVPGWKTSKLERSSSRSDLNETHTSREERTMSASAATEPVAVDAVGGGGDENKNKKKKKKKKKLIRMKIFKLQKMH